MSLMPIFGGRSYNGMTALQILQELKLTTGLQLCLDAGDSASYTSGQKWLDRSGNGYDFNRGVQTSSAVAITGTANSTMSAATSLVGVAIGAAAASRMVVVCLTYRDATDPTSLTIGGIAATSMVTPASEGEDNRTCAIWAAMVPTGTTATVAWTNAIEGGYSIFSVTGVATVTASDTLADSSDPMSGTIDIPANGGMIAVTNKTAGGTAVTWTGATEYSDFTEAGGSPDRHSAASRTTVAAETGHTVAVTSDFSVMLAVSWAPDPAGGAFTNEPTFNGTPGALNSTNYWSFDNDFFRYDSTNEAWMDNLHKDNAAWAALVWGYFTGTEHYIFGTNDNAPSAIGAMMRVDLSFDQVLAAIMNGSGTTSKVINQSGTMTSIAPNVWLLAGMSVDEAADTATSFANSATRTGTAAYTAPSASAATFTMELGSQGDASSLLPAGSRMAMVMMWSRALSTAEVSSIYSAMRGRFGV